MKPSPSTPSPDFPAPAAHSSTGTLGHTSSTLLRMQCPKCGERYPTHFVVCPRDATQLQEAASGAPDELIGTVLGDTYEVMRVIGEGGMGRVYEARHVRLFSKRFAIKVLYSDLTRQPEVVGRFLREAEATSALHHPNIVGVLDVNALADGRPYIVAELLEGMQLGEYFQRRGKLSVVESLALCRPVCQALIAAHDKDIVHRDIKPENLFLVGEGGQRTVKVLDFGISRVGDAQNSYTKTGIVMGTPAYMPPEQARGARVDHRADIYAVGAILYEAVTGKAPFEESDPVSTLGAVLTQFPAAPSSLAPEVPPELERVIEKAMAKSPDERYGTMRELDAALAQLELQVTGSYQRQSVAPPKPGYPPGLQRWLLGLYAEKPPELGRKRLWMLSIVSVACAFAALFTLGAGILRARFGAALSGGERAWSAGSALVLLVVPTLVWAHYLFWHVWPSTPRVNDVLARARRVLASGLVSYGLGMLLVRALGAARETPSLASWHGWDLIMVPIALGVAGIVAWLERASRDNEL
jgi:serine/threonine-protein kinase